MLLALCGSDKKQRGELRDKGLPDVLDHRLQRRRSQNSPASTIHVKSCFVLSHTDKCGLFFMFIYKSVYFAGIFFPLQFGDMNDCFSWCFRHLPLGSEGLTCFLRPLHATGSELGKVLEEGEGSKRSD